MAYADFTYYSTTYLGTAIVEANFPSLANRASVHIDQMTFGRAATETDATNISKIKMAMCALAEELQQQDTAPDGITSESQGQYSVAFGANSSRAKSNQSKIESLAKLWLSNTSLLFAGFHAGEYGGESDSE